MRNLKRALSLTLASVMLLGMMVIGTSAASYPDVDKDNNVEAIEVLQAVGVMQGDDKGNFDPDRTVSRNEMAIVMAKLLDLDYNYYSESCPFWDVPDYAKPYVGACYANGIVSGYNATQYGGSDTVTAVQAASMMMRALGYFKYDSDYKDGFVIATVRQASKIGLFADINASQDSPLTRDQVAQLALNTLETAMVDAEDNTLNISGSSGGMSMSVTGGQVNYIVRTSTEKFAEAINKDDKGNNNTDGRNGCTVELGEQLYNGDLRKDPATDDFERPATRWTYKFSEIGTYSNTPDYAYTTSISGDTPADKVKNMGLKGYTWDGVYYENGAKATCSGADSAERLGKLAADVAADGVLIEVFMDDDNTDTIEKVAVIRTQMMQVNAVSSKEVTLKKLDDEDRAAEGAEPIPMGNHSGFMTVKTVKEDDAGFEVLKDLKTDDYVLIVPVVDNSQYKVASAVVPETVNGVLETINTKSTDGKVKSIRVNGETYKMSYSWTAEDDELRRDTKLSSKQECQVFLDTYGYAIYVKDVKAANSAIIVDYIYSAVENGKIVKYAQGWDANGNELTLNLGTSPANVPNPEADIQGMVFEYKTSTVNDADYELILPKLAWADADTNIVYNYSTNGSDPAGQIVAYGDYTKKIGHETTAEKVLPFDSAVKFIYISTESGIGTDVTGITVKTGVSEVTVPANLTYILNGDRTKIVAVVVPNDDDAGNTASLLYLEAITSHSNNSNGKRVAYGTIWIDGEQIEGVELNKDYGPSDVDKFYTYSESNGAYILTPYDKTNKATSVQTGQVLTAADLVTDKQNYWFNGLAGDTLMLNGRDAKVFDLYSDDGKFYDTVKGMQDAIKNGDVSEKTNSAIANFKVSYIYNGDSGDSGYRNVKYVFITKSNEGVTPVGPTTPSKDTITQTTPNSFVYKVGAGNSGTPDMEVIANAVAKALNKTYDSTKGDTVTYADGAYTVKIGGMTYNVTINNSANGEVADKNDPDDIQSSLNGGNNATMVGGTEGSPAAATINKDMTVPADTTLTLPAGAAVTKPLTVTGTVKADANITTDGDGKVVLESTGTLELGKDVSTLPKIEAEENASLKVPAESTLTTAADAAVKFFKKNGEQITGTVPAGTYVWKENWTAARVAETGKTGWFATSDITDPVPGQKTKISSVTFDAFDAPATGVKLGEPALATASAAQVTATYAWNDTNTKETEAVKGTQYTLTVTLALKDAETTEFAEKVTATLGGKNGTWNATDKTLTFAFDAAGDPAQKRTVSVTGVGDYDVAGIVAGGYAVGDTVTITLTQKTGAKLDKDAKFTVTATGVDNLEGTVTKAGVAAVPAGKDSYEKAENVTNESFSQGEYYTKESDGSYKKAETFADGTDYYTKTPGTPAVDEVKGVITITFTMPDSDVSITGIAAKA